MTKTETKKAVIKDKYNRTFSEVFKREKVKELEKGVVSISALCKLYAVSRTSVYKWMYLYSAAEKGVKTVVEMQSEQHKTLYLQQRVAELERIIGQKQLEIDYLNQAFEMANGEVGYDLKKKYAQAPLNGLGTTPTATK